jgi:quinol monooxygenase YgiN
MITFVVRMRFAPEDRERVVEVLRPLTEASRQEPGCVTYIPHELADDPNTLVIYEQFRDAAAQEAHRNSAHFREYVIGGLYQWMRERSIEDWNALA